MSEETGLKLRRSYRQGWYELDAKLLISSTSPDFIFEDPFDPAPVTRTFLPDYMLR